MLLIDSNKIIREKDKRRKYIRWHDESKNVQVVITQSEFLEKLEKIKDYKYTPYSTIRKSYRSKTYSITIQDGKRMNLAFHDRNGYRIYRTNFKDDVKNNGLKSGKLAYNLVSDMFSKRTGKTINAAFGKTEEEFKRCIPKQFYYLNNYYLSSKYNIKKFQASSVDYSSQYPWGLIGLLPTADGMIHLKGRAEPTKEYPFAFYIKSGHVAQYNEFSTLEWIDSPFSKQLLGEKEKWDGDPFLDEKDDETILMKQSSEQFNVEMEHFYQLKKSQPEGSSDYLFAKLVLNAFIGMLHTDYYSHHQAHIVAVAIARANNRMRKLAEKVADSVIHICVDGLIYEGDAILGETGSSYLGQLKQETHDCEFYMSGVNCYMFKKNNKVVKLKHGAFDIRIDNKDIEKTNEPRDMFLWSQSKPRNLLKVIKEMKLNYEIIH